MKQLKLSLLALMLCACQSSTSAATSFKPPSTTEPIPTPVSNTIQAPTLAPRPSSSPLTETDRENRTPVGVLPITITVLYDNIGHDPGFQTDWGFSALIEMGEHQLLFDTGGDGTVLLRNLSLLEVDPANIENIVLSHLHADHTGGLEAILNTGNKPVIHIPPSFPGSFKASIEQKTIFVEVSPGYPIAEGALSTGELGSSIPEQALVLRTTMGLVIITGCAHPGIVQMVEQAIDLTGDPVYLVMGGFHLGDSSPSKIRSIIDAFRQLGVQKVAPSHCTGTHAIELFRETYGDDFIESGAGCVIPIQT